MGYIKPIQSKPLQMDATTQLDASATKSEGMSVNQQTSSKGDTKALNDFIKKNMKRTRGRYLFVFTKPENELQGIEIAIKWYYRMNGIDDQNLFITTHTYNQLKRVEEQIEHCLIKYHNFPLGTIAEWRAFEEERQEELAKIRKQKTIDAIGKPYYCEHCNLYYSMCECD